MGPTPRKGGSERSSTTSSRFERGEAFPCALRKLVAVSLYLPLTCCTWFCWTERKKSDNRKTFGRRETHVEDVEIDDAVSLREGGAVLTLLEGDNESVVLGGGGGRDGRSDREGRDESGGESGLHIEGKVEEGVEDARECESVRKERKRLEEFGSSSFNSTRSSWGRSPIFACSCEERGTISPFSELNLGRRRNWISLVGSVKPLRATRVSGDHLATPCGDALGVVPRRSFAVDQTSVPS